MRGSRLGFLRCAASALLLCSCLYVLGSAAERARAPETVSAEYRSLEGERAVFGTVLRDEESLSCPFEIKKTLPRLGERVRAGELIFLGEKGESLSAPCAGIFCGDRIVFGGWHFEAELSDTADYYRGQELVLCLEKDYNALVESVGEGTLTLHCREGLSEVLSLDEVEARLKLYSASGIRVPKSAIKRDGDGSFVYLCRAGRREKLYVKLKAEGSDYCLIEAEGLCEGMKIYTDG